MECPMFLPGLIRARPISPRGVSLIVLSLICFSAHSMAWADVQTDRFQAYAREQLQKPHRKTPYPCSEFWSGSRDGYVLDLTPWAAAAGLRRGDRPISYGGTQLTGVFDSDNEIWSRMPQGEHVDVRVERAGKEVSLRLPCRDDRPEWEAYVAIGRAIVEGRWQDCVDAVSAHMKATGYAPSGSLYTAIRCMLEKS